MFGEEAPEVAAEKQQLVGEGKRVARENFVELCFSHVLDLNPQ